MLQQIYKKQTLGRLDVWRLGMQTRGTVKQMLGRLDVWRFGKYNYKNKRAQARFNQILPIFQASNLPSIRFCKHPNIQASKHLFLKRAVVRVDKKGGGAVFLTCAKRVGKRVTDTWKNFQQRSRKHGTIPFRY